MTRFTDSPYEYMMAQKPYAGRGAGAGQPPRPPGGRCAGCPYGRGRRCVGVCMKEILPAPKKRGKEGGKHGKDI